MAKYVLDMDKLDEYRHRIQAGGYRTTSGAKVFGCDRKTFSNWLNYGQRDIDRGDEHSDYATLLRATEDAEADYEERAHSIVDGSDDWRAQAWRLERRLRETHGDVKQLNVTAQQGHTVSEATIREIGEEEMKQLAQLAFTGEKAG